MMSALYCLYMMDFRYVIYFFLIATQAKEPCQVGDAFIELPSAGNMCDTC